MSERKKSRSFGRTHQEKHEKPDSTTRFSAGEEVFVQNNDSFVLGSIKEVDTVSETCFVDIEDGENLWVAFKDLKPWSVDLDESSIKCSACKSAHSKKSNVVVSCDICFRAYHQKCHKPIIDSVHTNWVCKKCCKKPVCSVNAKTAVISKDQSLPSNNGKRNCCQKSSAQSSVNSYKGQKVCIKSGTPSFCVDDQRKLISRVKEKSPDKTIINSISDSAMHELPLTPPSSISAPETPQTLNVNGDLPVSPTDEISVMDFSDTASFPLENCNLEELFSSFDERPSDKSFPLQLNPVINVPPPRTTKRHLSKKEIVDGKIRRRRFRKQSKISISPIDLALPTTSHSRTELRIAPYPVLNKTTAKSDLKSQVYSYYSKLSKATSEYDGVTRLGPGQDYRVCGKRITSNGCVQYLIEWVQCTDPL